MSPVVTPGVERGQYHEVANESDDQYDEQCQDLYLGELLIPGIKASAVVALKRVILHQVLRTEGIKKKMIYPPYLRVYLHIKKQLRERHQFSHLTPCDFFSEMILAVLERQHH